MAIRFICPHCGHIINVADELDGRQGQCPSCNRFAMIQGQHIPDANVATVDIATTPENRPTLAGPQEKTVVIKRGAPAAGGFAPPPAYAPPPSYAPPASPYAPPVQAFPGSSGARGLPSPSSTSPTLRAPSVAAGSGELPAEDEEEFEEAAPGVGINKLLLSIIAGAVLAVGLTVSLWHFVLREKNPPVKDSGVKDKGTTISKDGNTGFAPPPSTIFDFSLKGRIGVVIHVGLQATERRDLVRKKIEDFFGDSKAREAVTAFTFVYPTPVGAAPDLFSGTGADIGKAVGWLVNGDHSHSEPDLAAAVKAALDKGLDAIVIVTDKLLQPEEVAAVKAAIKAKPASLYGVAVDDELARETLLELGVDSKTTYKHLRLSVGN